MLTNVEARYPLATLSKQGTFSGCHSTWIIPFFTLFMSHARNIKDLPYLLLSAVSSNPHRLFMMAQNSRISLCIFIILASGAKLYVNGANFTLVNQCKETIWPGISRDHSSAEGFTLQSSQTTLYNAPDGWSGRIWARTGCSFGKNGSSTNSTCQTGDCGPSLNCTGPSSLPITIVEFTVGNDELVDYYDVSLVDGFNIPIAVQPADGKGNCSIVGCDRDLRDSCPSELAVKSNRKVTACRSACNVFNTDEYCCRGTFSGSAACSSTNYSRTFKDACPAASSYGGEPHTVSCSASEYIVAFCALRNKITCTYHDHKVVCTNTNASEGFKAIPGSWWSLTLALPFTSLLHTFLL